MQPNVQEEEVQSFKVLLRRRGGRLRRNSGERHDAGSRKQRPTRRVRPHQSPTANAGKVWPLIIDTMESV